jgi:hypothetical protein
MFELFLDLQLPLLEFLEHRKVRHGAVQFFLDLALEASVLELKGADVRRFHWQTSF